MSYQHVNCGGEINTKTRTCLKCKKKFGLFSFWLSPTQIRQVTETRKEKLQRVREVTEKPTISKARYAEKLEKTVPGVAVIASRLPNWPRWARILVTVVLAAVVVGVVIILTSCNSFTSDTSDLAKVEVPDYRIESISDNLLILVIEIYEPSTRVYYLECIIDGLKEVSEDYTIVETTAITEKSGYGSRTNAILVQVEAK